MPTRRVRRWLWITPAVLAAVVAASLLSALAYGQFAARSRGEPSQALPRGTRIVPEAAERSTFVLAATVVLALLLWQWRPLAEPVIWSVSDPLARTLLHAVFWLGWGVLLVSTFLINHFELFGLRQVWANLTGRALPAPTFRTPLLYRHVRHPLYLGFVLAFWATPQMSTGRLLFAAACTGYILVGIWFEERDLVAQFGDRYRIYREQVGMLFPRLRARGGRPGSAAQP